MTEMPNFRSYPRNVLETWPSPRRRRRAAALALVVRPVLALGRAYARWRERERAIGELARLDDLMLADMGLRRGEIRSVVIDAQSSGWPAERRRSR